MSGDEQLGDGHASWHSEEELPTPNGMCLRKSHKLNYNNFNYYTLKFGIDKYENAIVKRAPRCTNEDR